MIVTIHGRQFEIAVSDWEKPEDAKQIADIVHNWLLGLSTDSVTRLHAELAAYQAEPEGAESKMTQLVIDAFEACEAATASLFEEWGFVPETGHQCHLYAR
jgi:hypothetical protein